MERVVVADEPGAELVEVEGSAISAVNWSEVLRYPEDVVGTIPQGEEEKDVTPEGGEEGEQDGYIPLYHSG